MVRFKKEHESVYPVDGKPYFSGYGKPLHVISPSPVPVMLQACYEARKQGRRYYQQAFTKGDKPRYVGVNFELDMVLVGHDEWGGNIQDEEPLIRRLSFESENDESFAYFRSREMPRFSNVEEIHVVSKDSLLEWQEAWEHVCWPCEEKNVRFIDKETGQIMDGYELDRMSLEWEMANGWVRPENSRLFLQN